MVSAQNDILTEARLYHQVEHELFTPQSVTHADRVGLEVELLALKEATLMPVALAGSDGLLSWLSAVAAAYGWVMDVDAFDNAVLEPPGGGRITLEPAGQIEYSSPTKSTPGEALADLNRTVDILEEEARGAGIRLAAVGYNRFCAEEDLQLAVVKPRYRYMDRHFSTIGEFGRKMMRATCALQINLDFGPPEIASERWRLANMIAPSLNAIFANSPHLHDGLLYRSFRYEIWRRTDPSRTGRLYDRPDLDPIADYLRFGLDASVMLVSDGSGGCRPADHAMTFRQWMAEPAPLRRPDLDDWRLHLSTLFPDVRPRGWMELRTVDCLPRQWQAVPVALAATLLYDERLRREALRRLELSDRQTESGEHEHGGAWRSDFTTGCLLLEMAIPRIADAALAATAHDYLDRFLRRGLTPADYR